MSNLALDSNIIDQQWLLIQENLHAKYGDNVFRNWFAKLSFSGYSNGQVVLSAPTRFVREWIINNYVATIRQLWQHYDQRVITVEIEVDNQSATNNPINATISLPTQIAKVTQEIDQEVRSIFNRQAALDEWVQPVDNRYTFNNFVVGSSNQLAYTAARSVADNAEPQPGCNPLFLYGSVGLGKTHLMQAIANHLRTYSPERKVLYLSAEKFMFLFIRALRDKNIMQFKENLRSVDVLMIDDVQFICGKDSTQEEFFYTLNDLIENKRQVVISCDRSPNDLAGMEDRIKSRLGWGLVADVHSTNYELRLGILQSKVEELKASIPLDVLELLASRITSNVRELEGALNKIIAYANFTGKAITVANTLEILRDLLRTNDQVITVEDIQREVATLYQIRLADMSSKRRLRNLARPRQIAMYLAKLLTTKSLVEIGRQFGGKDHTTVMHAIKQVEKLLAEDQTIASDIANLKKTLTV